jgi:hypothetical protein
MPERGRGSGPDDNESEGQEQREAPASGGYTGALGSPRVIAPYDPYRSRTANAPRRDAADPIAPPGTASRRDDPFLPDDDPLSAEAWQLELEDDDILPEERQAEPVARDAPPRRARRQPERSQESREASTAARRSPRRARTRTATRGEAGRPTVTIGVPQIVAGSPLIADQTALLLLGINVVSVVVMALFVGIRVGAIPSPTVLRLDAAGNPALWGSPGVLWRLPLMSASLAIMFLAVAWFLHPLDRFAARFALGAAVVAQLIAWVAVIQHLA